MAEDTVAIAVPLDDGGVASLQFRRGVFERLVAEAHAEGQPLRDFLLRRMLASGLGEECTAEREE